ncbi:MAG: hypothetical protein EA401_03095 [Planctomycetota bacterium]|nr:MAG: hypothetical protein EA401_03095 [Planctomycetota bacterium]
MRLLYYFLVTGMASGILCLSIPKASPQEQEQPPLTQAVTEWNAHNMSLVEQMAQVDALLEGLDTAMEWFLSLPQEPPATEAVMAMSRLHSRDDATAVREWLRLVDERIQEHDGDLSDPDQARLRVERLAVFLEIFATLAERMGDEAAMDRIVEILALHLYLPHRQYPQDQQEAAYKLLQHLARSFPEPSPFTWPMPREDATANEPHSWQLVVGPRAQRNLLTQIGPQRFQQVLQSLPPEALSWSIDYHGYPNALLENRLSLRIDHQRNRLLLEEITLNLRVESPVDATPDANE